MKNKDEAIKFSKVILDIVSEKKIGYLDAIVYYCGESGLEVEVAAKLLTSGLKGKIREEAEELHLLKKTPRLLF